MDQPRVLWESNSSRLQLGICLTKITWPSGFETFNLKGQNIAATPLPDTSTYLLATKNKHTTFGKLNLPYPEWCMFPPLPHTVYSTRSKPCCRTTCSLYGQNLIEPLEVLMPCLKVPKRNPKLWNIIHQQS